MPAGTESEKTEFITTEQLIGRALDRGIVLGPNPHQTINLYIQRGLVPQLINGMHPAAAVDRIVSIDSMLKEGKSLEEIQEIIRKERRSFLRKAVDLTSLVNTYNNSTFKSLLMLGSLLVLAVLSIVAVTSVSPASKTFAGGVVHEAAKPVGITLAAIIRQAKPENENSTDPLGLTNISKVITINEKQQVVLEKTVSVASPNTEISSNLNADKVDNADAGTGAGNVLLLDNSGDIGILGEIKGSKFTGDGSGLTNLSLPTTLLYSNQSYANPSWLTSLAWSKLASRPSLVTSVDSVSNDLGDVDFVAGAGVTITPNDTNNTITFDLAGSGVNADLLDSIDSSQFLRSDTADSFTSGTLTMAGGTTLNVLGTFSCTDCVGDAAVSNTITVGSSSSVSATAINSGTLGNAGTTLALGSFGSITGSLGDSNIANTLTIDAAGSVSATAANSGTLGNAGVTLALGSFGSITGGLGDANVDNAITVSNYLPLAGGTMAGNINFNTSLALNIGNAGTDFTASGGLNMAGDLDTEGHAAFGSSSSPVAATILRLIETRSDEEVVNGLYSIPTSTYNDLGNPSLYGIVSVPTYSGADTSASIYGVAINAMYTGSGSASLVVALSAGITTSGAGSVTTTKGISIATPVISGAAPTTAYGLEINDLTSGGTRYPIYQGGTNGTNVFLAGTSLFGRTASGNDTAHAVVIQGSLCVDDSTPSCPAGPTVGAIYVENSIGTGTVSAFDIAEYYLAIEATEKGDLVSAAGDLAVKKSNQPYDKGVIGIVSTNPAAVIDETNITFGKTAGSNFNPLKPYIALAGRAPVKVSTENGVVEAGDPLTSSGTPGVAMKATKSGPIVGKALEAYSGSGVGKIEVFVSVGWYVEPLAQDASSKVSDLSSLNSINLENLTANSLNTQFLMIGDRKLSMLNGGSLSIDGNTEIVGSLKVAGTIDTKNLKTDELEIGAKSSGQTTLSAGTQEVEVKTGVVKDGSKIFITFNDDYSPATRYWITKNAGSSFTLHLNTQLDKNTSFSWLLIN